MKSIFSDFEWLKGYSKALSSAWSAPGEKQPVSLPEPPAIPDTLDQYGGFVTDAGLDKYERLGLILALSPHLSHTFLQLLNLDGNPALLRQNNASGAIMPTGETFLFLASGGKEDQKLMHHHILGTSHLFYKKSVLDLVEVDGHFPPSYGVLTLGESFRDLFLYDRFSKPRYNAGFPAHLLETRLTWDDLVLNNSTRKSLDEIQTFMTRESELRGKAGLDKHMKPGYRALFYGPSGTGKTLAVTLLGKELNRDVYRVDLSMVVSKYIGETSKNLNSLFNTAEDKDWILFFDEGDAVFSKRSDTGSDDKNAKYANQETAFLLQRIESYNGLVIVATNYRQNLDQAFARRFQCIINFNIPDDANRRRLWTENVPADLPFAEDISIDQVVKTHLLSAASIMKVIHRASLRTLQNNDSKIRREVLEFCIRDEEFNNK